jgi:hypothetical protein
MHSAGSFEPEDISLLKGVLDDAFAALPPRLRVLSVQALVAERILKSAANGERDRVRLRTVALFDLQAAARLLIGIDDRVG